MNENKLIKQIIKSINEKVIEIEKELKFLRQDDGLLKDGLARCEYEIKNLKNNK
jgi:hypothetical protein